MRSKPTAAEARLWTDLRCRRIAGFKFRRQARMYGYIADFYCSELSLVIEVDGSSHHDRRAYDAQRDEHLAARGIQTLRVSNDEVFSGAAVNLISLVVRTVRTVPTAA